MRGFCFLNPLRSKSSSRGMLSGKKGYGSKDVRSRVGGDLRWLGGD